MPTLAKTDIVYSDIDFSFLEHPVKKELSRKTNEAAVIQSLRNLIMTNFYERPFQPQVGCGLRGLLFENISPIVQKTIESTIYTTIKNFERKRVRVISIHAVPDIENNLYRVKIVFSLLNNAEPISLSVILQRVR